MKQQLIDYLNSFKSLINVNFKGEKKITNIELFSGIKPASYYIPNILGYLNHPPYSNRSEMVEIAWFVEIWIDNVCIWRKSRLNETGENLQQYEDELIKETIREIVMYGLNSSWNMIAERRQKIK